MKTEQAKKLTDDALQKLAAALEQGKSETLKNYLAAMARFYDYSFGNILLIFSQRPDATQVAGFKTWKKFGRHVRKGEKGILIIAPIIGKVEEEEGECRKLVGFKAAYVFDVSQTEGDVLPELGRVQGDPAEHIDALKAYLGARGIGLEYAEDLGGADGRSKGGIIAIRPGMDPAEEFSVLVHETAHEMLHHGDDRPKSKTVRETEAEAVAYAVCEAVGLSTNTAAIDYIQIYHGDHETLMASLERIQNTASEILGALLQAA